MVLIITSPFASPAFSGAVIIVGRTDSSVGVGCLVRCATHHRPSHGLYHTWCTFYYSARASPSRTRILINSRHYPTAKAITTSLAHVYAYVSSLTLPRSIGVFCTCCHSCIVPRHSFYFRSLGGRYTKFLWVRKSAFLNKF